MEFSKHLTRLAPGTVHGRQDSNLRHPVLETGALTVLSYTHIKLLRHIQKGRPGRCPGGRLMSVARYRCHLARNGLVLSHSANRLTELGMTGRSHGVSRRASILACH